MIPNSDCWKTEETHSLAECVQCSDYEKVNLFVRQRMKYYLNKKFCYTRDNSSHLFSSYCCEMQICALVNYHGMLQNQASSKLNRLQNLMK